MVRNLLPLPGQDSLSGITKIQGGPKERPITINFMIALVINIFYDI